MRLPGPKNPENWQNLHRVAKLGLARITELYLEGPALKKSSLIVAPTHAEARTIAAGVRAAMKKNGLLAKEDHVFSRLEGIDLTESQRRDPIGF